MNLGVRRGARPLRELVIIATFSNGNGSGKMFDSLQCRLAISWSSASGLVLRVVSIVVFEWHLTISQSILHLF